VKRRRALACLLLIASAGVTAPARAQQSFTPQSGAGLTVSFTTEKAGGSRVLVFGEVRNTTNNAAERVVVSAEGLDDTGRVVSRGRSFVSGTVPSRGGAPFEIRISASGSEKRYRVQIESFQFQFLQGN
jgi:hypothetical protein